jgi:hypothetical protein
LLALFGEMAGGALQAGYLSIEFGGFVVVSGRLVFPELDPKAALLLQQLASSLGRRRLGLVVEPGVLELLGVRPQFLDLALEAHGGFVLAGGLELLGFDLDSLGLLEEVIGCGRLTGLEGGVGAGEGGEEKGAQGE